MFKFFIILKENSLRVTRKNFRTIGDLPMYKHLLYELQGQHVYVDTDSDRILHEIAQDVNLRHVHAYKRSEELVRMEEEGNVSPVLKLIKNFLVKHAEEEDTIITPHTTSPFLTLGTIRKALETYVEGQYDSVSSVTEHKEFSLINTPEGLRPINFDPSVVQRTQDLSPIIQQNGAFFIFSKESFLRNDHRIGEKHKYFPIGFPDYIEIDTEEDLKHAKAVYKGLR